MARVQSVRTDAGWHGRVSGNNGEPVWTTEVYDREESVQGALYVLAELMADLRAAGPVSILEDVDDRSDAHD